MCEKYDGWTNRETWLVKLWLDNEEALQEISQEIARAAGRRPYEQEDALAAWVAEEVCPATDHASLEADLLGTALARVNWREIHKALTEDAAEIASAN